MHVRMMPHIEIAAETLIALFGIFPITNALLTSWVALMLIVVGTFIIRKARMIPAGFQNIVETIMEAFLALMRNILGSEEKAFRFLPFVGTVFVFILISNWIGILPGVGSIEFSGSHGTRVPLFRSAASDLNFTLALGIVAVLMINAYAMREVGLGSHLRKFFTLRNPIHTFVGILELISEFAKIVSFSFRLFGNVFAGEVLLTVIAFVAGVLTPRFFASFAPFSIAVALVPFVALEIFVGFIQALVFAMLALVFLGIATADHSAHKSHSLN